MYICGLFDGDLNLAVWQILSRSPNNALINVLPKGPTTPLNPVQSLKLGEDCKVVTKYCNLALTAVICCM